MIYLEDFLKYTRFTIQFQFFCIIQLQITNLGQLNFSCYVNSEITETTGLTHFKIIAWKKLLLNFTLIFFLHFWDMQHLLEVIFVTLKEKKRIIRHPPAYKKKTLKLVIVFCYVLFCYISKHSCVCNYIYLCH